MATELRRERALRDAVIENSRRYHRERELLAARLREARRRFCEAAAASAAAAAAGAAGGGASERCVLSEIAEELASLAQQAGGAGNAWATPRLGDLCWATPRAEAQDAVASISEKVAIVPLGSFVGGLPEAQQETDAISSTGSSSSSSSASSVGAESDGETAAAAAAAPAATPTATATPEAPHAPSLPAASTSLYMARAAPSPGSSFLSAATTLASAWRPNAKACARCCAAFTLLRRRHHCRRCGECVCHACSPFLVHLEEPVMRPAEAQGQYAGESFLSAEAAPASSFAFKAGPWARERRGAYRVCRECHGPKAVLPPVPRLPLSS